MKKTDSESISFITSVQENENTNDIMTQTGDVLPILPLRDRMLFPNVIMPISVGRESSLKLVKEAEKSKSDIAIICQMDPQVEDPLFDDLNEIGVVGKVIRVMEMPDNDYTAIVQSTRRIKLLDIQRTKPYLMGEVEVLVDKEYSLEKDPEYISIIDECVESTIRYIKTSTEKANKEAAYAIRQMADSPQIVNFICTNIDFDIRDKMVLIGMEDVKKRGVELIRVIKKLTALEEIKLSIKRKTQAAIEDQQREFFLNQQIKTIQEELGNDAADQEVNEIRKKGYRKRWNANVAEVFNKEVNKLERINPQTPEYNVQLNYLQTMLSLPWEVYTKDNENLATAERILNRDHYGLEKVKERIMEHLAVLKLNRELKAPILCLYGPPGVGKTSLGKSIADALKRKYVRMSLGGVHDEAEIRGHRKTYIGAMPGRIIKNIIKAKSSNPVFILDEIDKLASDHQGDPASALLEVLDPEQNTAFHDNFLDVDYDLSKVLFIATANNLNTIPEPLLDRMEIIEVSGYITEEKIEIAKRHLIPKELKANGLKKEDVKLSKPTIEAIIESYTRESGVRELEKKIGKVMRKTAYDMAKNGTVKIQNVKPADLEELLGIPEYTRDKYQGNEYAGVVTGLAWTAVGGEILFIETSLSRGKGQLTLTGNLGDVMKESAMLALEYIKAHAQILKLDNEIFQNWNIHIHVPEGAIPKDGPSAGITMATSLASALTQRKVKPNMAMTGEITLRGKVLPVGGIKEKILAAKRAGIREIVLSEENRRHIEDIPEIYLKGLTFHYVKDIKDVFELALTDELVKNPIDLNVKDKNKA